MTVEVVILVLLSIAKKGNTGKDKNSMTDRIIKNIPTLSFQFFLSISTSLSCGMSAYKGREKYVLIFQKDIFYPVSHNEITDIFILFKI